MDDIFINEIEEAKEIERKLAIIDEKISELEELKKKLLRLEDVDVDNLVDPINFEENISKLLTKTLRCNPAHKGYQYLLEAFKLVKEDSNIIYGQVTKELYPDVAKICRKKLKNPNITISKVERGMRHTIQSSIKNIDKKDFETIFGVNPHLTNSAYIAYVMEYYKNLNYNKSYKKRFN